ncbi:MAG: class I SAM-dependent methyltransferase [Gammaproteobacteria bacterium]
MTQSMDEVSPSLKSAYDEQYSDEMTPWRELCASAKARNIMAVSAGHRFERVLECGAGEGSILKFLDEAGFCRDLYAIDISDSGIAGIRKRQLPHLREVKKFDGYRIPYADDAFDMVYCSHVLEHVEHPRVLLRELARVSRYQVFEVPLDYSPTVDDQWKHYHSYGHISVFTPGTFRFLLKSEGFQVHAQRYTRNTPEVIRYNWYRNMKMRANPVGEIKLMLWPIYRLVRRLQLGRSLYRELEFSAFTCFTERGAGLKVF